LRVAGGGFFHAEARSTRRGRKRDWASVRTGV
jgi:hypothetical protein